MVYTGAVHSRILINVKIPEEKFHPVKTYIFNQPEIQDKILTPKELDEYLHSIFEIYPLPVDSLFSIGIGWGYKEKEGKLIQAMDLATHKFPSGSWYDKEHNPDVSIQLFKRKYPSGEIFEGGDLCEIGLRIFGEEAKLRRNEIKSWSSLKTYLKLWPYLGEIGPL